MTAAPTRHTTHNPGLKWWWLAGIEHYDSQGRDALSPLGFIEQLGEAYGETLLCTEVYRHDTQVGWGAGPELLNRNPVVQNVRGLYEQYARSLYGARFSGSNPNYWRTYRDALSFQYSGPGTGTWSKTGGSGGNANGATDAALVFKVAGSTVATVQCVTAGVARPISEIVTAINGISGGGWAATIGSEPNILTAPFIQLPAVGAFQNWTDLDAKTAPVAAKTFGDVHSDVFNINGGGGAVENVAIVNCLGFNTVSALQILGQGGTAKDVAIVNSGSHVTSSTNEDWTGTMSHVMEWHWGNVSGAINHTASMDAFCSFKNSIYNSNTGAGSIASAEIDNNHYMTTSGPASATNTTTGGTAASLLTDVANGDFSPKAGGGLKTGTSLIPFDALGNARGATSHIGPIA
jgi:hypothetical protein